MKPFSAPAFLLLVLLVLSSSNVLAAPSSKPLDFWNHSNESNLTTVDHSTWQGLLNRNVIDQHPSGINRFNYAGISETDKRLLSSYLEQMQALDPRELSRGQQKAYWINLYNALTINLVISHYPVESITKLGDSLFSFGPWDDEISQIAGESLSLNDIEHRILRPLFPDNRIHYAVNCASLGCPNLAKQAYTAEHLEEQLEKAARDYINHPRGVDFKEGVLWVSSIYDWYRDDFGGSDRALLRHLVQYAAPSLAEKLGGYEGRIKDHYDWALNSP